MPKEEIKTTIVSKPHSRVLGVTILAIESSCDETSAAVCVDGKILSNYIANQTVHEQYGGVVPELASRAHMQNIVPVVDAAIKTANIELSEIDAIAFTQAPGLIGSLLVGGQFAKSLSLSLNKPLIAVHHMQAHVLANLINDPKPSFPFLCLTVSGGHPKRFKFPEPKIEGLNFSFSGLKTSILYFLQNAGKSNLFKAAFTATEEEKKEFIENNLPDICASIQYRIVTILLNKLKKASVETGIKDICIAGGVSANSGLRKAFEETGKQLGWNTFIPAFEYCTDNAGMIAITGYYKYMEGKFAELSINSTARAEW